MARGELPVLEQKKREHRLKPLANDSTAESNFRTNPSTIERKLRKGKSSRSRKNPDLYNHYQIKSNSGGLGQLTPSISNFSSVKPPKNPRPGTAGTGVQINLKTHDKPPTALKEVKSTKAATSNMRISKGSLESDIKKAKKFRSVRQSFQK